MKNHFTCITLLISALLPFNLTAQSLEKSFLEPTHDAKAIMIWEWMDGCVTREGITADLEAYKAAGLGGVQQFLVGGGMQSMVKNTDNAIGTDNWRSLMRYAIDECARLGLSFGTHNCPGWSSSAYPTVKPEYSMQILVWSETRASGNGKEQCLQLPRPEVDPQWNYYEDVTVVAVPAEGVIAQEEIHVLNGVLDADGTLKWVVPEGDWMVYRFGHTTNGKDNHGTAPDGGIGLECDKMSRAAADHFWSLYPAEIIRIAGPHAGKTLQRFEIDSYEQLGQSWTPLLPEDFLHYCGYDLLTWLPVFAGRTIVGDVATAHFWKDYTETCQTLVATNYYGRLSELAHEAGMVIVVEPWGTGGEPFNPVDTRKVIYTMAQDDQIAAEFWTRPDNWGWPEVPMVVDLAHETGHETIYAESFSCVPGYAWIDDPDSIKRVADKAFCYGINSFMLHAAAQNPWPHVKPGMTFGVWGTQWTQSQTWWKDGAPALFSYFTRCQSLLQRGKYVDSFRSLSRSLSCGNADLHWIHRKDGDADLYFVANRTDAPMQTVISLEGSGRVPELWNPENCEIQDAGAWLCSSDRTEVLLDLEAGQSMFVVLRHSAEGSGPGLTPARRTVLKEIQVKGPWTLHFAEGWGAPEQITLSALSPWNESEIEGIKYFSGTARYVTTLRVNKIDNSSVYELDLGEVKNLAVVRINGKTLPTLWRTPFRVDVTGMLHKGDNQLEIEVTNLWKNRLIGDEHEPDDILFPEPGQGSRWRMMLEEPDWLRNNTPRPSQGRKAVVSFKSVTKDDPLLPSGLLGPVVLRQVSRD